MLELLAPAGNFEKLKTAIRYGADSVYLGAKDFSLRNFSGNFTIKEVEKAVEYAKAKDVKVYIACNVYSRNEDWKDLPNFLKTIGDIGPDALIVSDPGIFLEAKDKIPEIPIHISTQSNTTNYKAALFWEKLGAKRINAAREISLKEIREIADNSFIEIEAFVHGAMCIAYSGRCLLSGFLTGRESNRGLCAQPCRWQYSVIEETRPDQYMPISEDSRGTYLFSSMDICMIEHIPEMINAGICSLKIEGRMKGLNYLATTVKVYREAIDSFYNNPENWKVKESWIKMLCGISRRDYCKGFYFESKPYNNAQLKPRNIHNYIGKVKDSNKKGIIEIVPANRVCIGDTIEIMTPDGPCHTEIIIDIFDIKGASADYANAGMPALFKLSRSFKPGDIVRKKI